MLFRLAMRLSKKNGARKVMKELIMAGFFVVFFVAMYFYTKALKDGMNHTD